MKKDKSNHRLELLILVLVITVLSCQGVSNLPNPFATETPTPTATLTPSPTPSPAPSITPSPTSIPTGVSIETLPNKSTQVVDFDGGYVLILVENWIPIPADPEAFMDVVERSQESNPELANALDSMQEMMKDDSLRLLSLNVKKEFRDGKIFPNMFVVSIEDKMMNALPLDFLVETNAEQLVSTYPNSKVEDYGTDANKNNVEYGFINVTSSIRQGRQTINAYQTIFFLKVGNVITIFTVTLPISKRDIAPSVMQDMIDSIYLLDNPPPTFNG